ncbi:hypothetical protein EUGRSUZ_E01829 [Eucalyptus grandis]|uniref:Uncharacterized protein n=2 Tax=Eucalyptus grandis TaxID=71139 RepID=A0ACC3KVV0_EUCGR|nr:hypothetical protein EUGRSUZ_E01829 [Eucalyptus grandis]
MSWALILVSFFLYFHWLIGGLFCFADTKQTAVWTKKFTISWFKAEEEGYDVSKFHKTPHSDSPPEEEGPKDTKGVWWIKSILGR